MLLLALRKNCQLEAPNENGHLFLTSSGQSFVYNIVLMGGFTTAIYASPNFWPFFWMAVGLLVDFQLSWNFLPIVCCCLQLLNVKLQQGGAKLCKIPGDPESPIRASPAGSQNWGYALLPECVSFCRSNILGLREVWTQFQTASPPAWSIVIIMPW